MSAVNLPGSGSSNQDVDLNIAPIIDCLVVLIAFMMISLSYIAIGTMDAGIAAGALQNKSTTPPPVTVTIDLQANNKLVIEISGKQNSKIPIAPIEGKWNLNALGTQLVALKQKWPAVTGVTLKGENSTSYKEIIQTMEVIRKNELGVLLGGF